MKRLSGLLYILFAFLSLQYLAGCGGSDVEEENADTKKKKDSVSVYTALENARIHYTKALQFNEQADSKSSGEEFETALKNLNKIDTKNLAKHITWEKDYNELATSIVQDYITAHPDLSDEHKVFKLAAKLGIKDKDWVSVETCGVRKTIFCNVLARVSDKFDYEMHLDTDEANAAGLKNDDYLKIIPNR